MTGMDGLVTWLRAQLDEDERVARQVTAEPGGFYLEAETDDTNVMTIGAYVYRWSPKRVLAEVDAKRRIIRLYENALSAHRAGSISHRNRTQDEAAADVLGATVRLLALPHADRPGYLQEWAPDGS